MTTRQSSSEPGGSTAPDNGPHLVVAALVDNGDDLLLVRHGDGPAGGRWALPNAQLKHGETMAEAVVRALADSTGRNGALCGPFIGWSEVFDPDTASHEVSMVFNAVLIDDDQDKANPRFTSGSAAEWRWTPTWEVPELRLKDGLTEFLADQGIIDLLT